MKVTKLISAGGYTWEKTFDLSNPQQKKDFHELFGKNSKFEPDEEVSAEQALDKHAARVASDFLTAMGELKNPNRKIIKRMSDCALKHIWCGSSVADAWESEQKKLTENDADQKDIAVYHKLLEGVERCPNNS